MIDTIYITRHGFRMNWVTPNWSSPTGTDRDPPLAALGETQASELANHFLNLPEDDRPTAIISSPYYRCLQTAVPASQALGVPIFIEHGLSEWYSPVQAGTGLLPRPGSSPELKAYFSDINPSWTSVWYPSRKGETIDAVHDRARGCLEALQYQFEQKFPNQHKRVLLVSHAATVIALIRALVGDKNLPLRIGCCSLTILKRRDDMKGVSGAFFPVKLGSGDHLRQGASRDWGFDDVVVKDGEVIKEIGDDGADNEDNLLGCQIPSLELSAKM